MLDASVGPFQLDEPMGRGAMGSVWRAVHHRSRVPVAIKVIAKTQEAQPRETLDRELQAVAAMRHRGIVSVLDYGTLGDAAAQIVQAASGSPWLAMELATLGSLLDTPPHATWPGIADLLDQLLAALAHAHARRVIHRDLKPANVLVFPSGLSRRYAIADFGVAYALDRERASSAGTPRFMAPEQFARRWRDQGPWTDLYSLGCLAWEVVTGEVLFRAKTIEEFANAHRFHEPGAFRPRLAVPSGFEDWLRGLLVKGIGRRIGHAAVARAQLHALGSPEQSQLMYSPPVAFSADTETVPTLTSRTTGALTFFIEDDPTPLSIPHAPQRAAAPEILTLPERPPLPQTGRGTDRRLFDAGLGLLGIRETPLAGRRTEQHALWNGLREVCEQRARRTFVIDAPSGYGRTRLARWIGAIASEYTPVRTLFIDHALGARPGRSLTHALVRYFRLAELTGSQAAERLNRLGVPGAELLAATLEGSIASPPIWVDLFRELQSTIPLVLVFDDPDRDAVSLKLVEMLHAASDLSVLLVLTGDEESPRARALRRRLQATGAVRLPLRPLGDRDMRGLLVDHLGLHESAIGHLAERSGGSPAIAVQTLIDWAEAGVLIAGQTRIALTGPPPPHEPTDAWSRRAIRLHTLIASGARRALELVAVLGFAAHEERWDALCTARGVTPEDLRIARASVTSRGLMKRNEAGVWHFIDARVRHALLGRIVRPTARRDQEEAARLAAAAGDQSAAGRHLAAAGKHEAAAQSLLSAVEQRLAAPYESESLLLLELAEQCLQNLATRASDPQWGRLHSLRCHAFAAAGLDEEALDLCEQLIARSKAHGNEWSAFLARGLYMKGTLLQARGRLHDAITALHSALDAPATPNLSGMAARIHASLAEAYLTNRDFSMAEQELMVLETLPDPSGLHAVLIENGRAEVARSRGDLDAARAGYEHALALIGKEQDHYRQVTLLNLALVHILSRSTGGALAILEDLHEDVAAHERSQTLGAVLTLKQEAYAQSGRWDDWDRHLPEMERFLGELAHESDLLESLERQLALAHDAGHSARVTILDPLIRSMKH